MNAAQARSRQKTWLLVGVVLALAVAGGVYVVTQRQRLAGLPSPSSAAYEQTTRQFYRALAELQVGLLDAARQDFEQATTLAPGEPATWANLGLAQLRLGEFDAAAAPIERASALAPSNSAVAFLAGRFEIARGRRDEGIARLRRAVDLDPRNLPARTALIQEIENGGGQDADAEAERLLQDLFALQPENLAVIVERARLAAKRADAATLHDLVRRMERFADAWPPDVVEQFRSTQQASQGPDTAGAAREMAFLRNALASVPAFREGRRLVTPSAELIAEPFTQFLRLPTPVATPAAPDQALSFTREPLADAKPAPILALTAFSPDGESRPIIAAVDGQQLYRADAPGSIAPLGPGAVAAPLALLALDWNNDFRMDLVVAGPTGVRLFLQSADGAFADRTAAASRGGTAVTPDATGVWAADIEMDGDLDLIVGVRDAEPVVLRNNGDGTWLPIRPFTGLTGLRAFVWGDIDRDGDADAVLVDGAGELHVLANLQSGRFQRVDGPHDHSNLEALALGDVNADGALDLVMLDAAGAIRRASISPDLAGAAPSWSEAALVTVPRAPRPGAGARVIVADLDNNGALDLLTSDEAGTAIWLAGPDNTWHPLGVSVEAQVVDVVDLTGDGQLDLVGLSAGTPVRLIGQGTRGYHAQIIRPRAQEAAGDQRINAFGIGGEIEVRSGRLVLKQIVTGPAVHVGLGSRTNIDVVRIVWPNGVLQVDFDPAIDQPIMAQQRLKGSCPWVFADDGTGMRFVTDFLWRSPLGLRINAVDTAGVTQTEDWVRIRGDQLVARDGAYDIRISAELWETHFIDQISLMVVDHPSDVSVYVDERFAREVPRLAVQTMRAPRPVAHAWDQAGREVTDLVSRQDGRYLDTFPRGQYQGVGADHFVELDLGAPIPRGVRTWLVAYGWIYPTDSSINVAIGQGGTVQPRGLSLEAQDARGRWVVVTPDLGFPSGKNKTVLIDLSAVERAGVVGARRLRLRTNLEIYWDAIGAAEALPGAPITMTRLAPAVADLRYRGFSQTKAESRTAPEVPVYDRVANTMPRWRDLVGYYTRFGDVRELLATAEDRYVIMNAGDELRLSFPAAPLPGPGWARDFVLIGDGWVKDGDYNTRYSKTVEPLPAHGHPDYTASSATPALAQDPVYRSHRDDWRTFHTRFVTPQPFLDGLRER